MEILFDHSAPFHSSRREIRRKSYHAHAEDAGYYQEPGQ